MAIQRQDIPSQHQKLNSWMISANQIKHHTIVGIEDILEGVTLQCLLCLLFLTWNVQGQLTQHNVNCEDFWAKLQFCIRILIYALLIISSKILRIACYALLCRKSEEILEMTWENRFEDLRNPLTLSLTLSDITWNRSQIPDPNLDPEELDFCTSIVLSW
jgi:hypothetical protein